MKSMNHEEHEGKPLTHHDRNRAHAGALEVNGEILGPAIDGNIMLNQNHEMYAQTDGEALMHEAYAVTDGEAMLRGGMPSADDAQDVDACRPKHEGARKTNQMILNSYDGVSER